MLWLLAAYALWTAGIVIGGSFVNLFYKDAGIGIVALAISYLFWAAAPIFVIHLLDGRTLDLRTVMAAGALIEALAYALFALLPPSALLLCAVSFLLGMNSFLFWGPMNIAYFGMGKGKEATYGALYFGLNPLFGIVLPLVGGALAAAYGFQLLFWISAALFVLVVPFAFASLSPQPFSYGARHCLDGLKGFRTLMFLEGAYGGALTAVIGVVPLLYFTSSSGLGMYLSVTTLFSVLASFVTGRLSDASRKRKKYIAAFGSGLGVSTALCTFAGTAFLWSAAMSLRNFFSALFYPFTTAILADNRRDSIGHAMVGREWLLNWGRIPGVAIVVGAAILGGIQLSLALAGLLIMAYPVVVEMKKQHIQVD